MAAGIDYFTSSELPLSGSEASQHYTNKTLRRLACCAARQAEEQRLRVTIMDEFTSIER
jgi:hypothetical protein